MCIRDRATVAAMAVYEIWLQDSHLALSQMSLLERNGALWPVSYTHLRAHETVLELVCRLLLEKKHCYYAQHSVSPTSHLL